jgi:hypothetical protein
MGSVRRALRLERGFVWEKLGSPPHIKECAFLRSGKGASRSLLQDLSCEPCIL